MAGPFKMKAGKEGPMKKNFNISPVKDIELGLKSKQLINKAKKVAKKVKTFVKGFSAPQYSD